MKEDIIDICEKEDALVIYKYLVLYNEFEMLLRKIFINEWENISPQCKNRIAFYVGWLGSEVRYIDYDSFSIRQEVHKYDERSLISKMTINQLIKIDKIDRMIPKLSFEIQSKAKRFVTFLSHECFLALLNMRNKLAHNICNINFKNSDVIELLPVKILETQGDLWVKEINLERITERSQNILSNYIYMKDMLTLLGKEEQ